MYSYSEEKTGGGGMKRRRVSHCAVYGVTQTRLSSKNSSLLDRFKRNFRNESEYDTRAGSTSTHQVLSQATKKQFEPVLAKKIEKLKFGRRSRKARHRLDTRFNIKNTISESSYISNNPEEIELTYTTQAKNPSKTPFINKSRGNRTRTTLLLSRSNTQNTSWFDIFRQKDHKVHKVNKSVADVRYKGNANDIGHLLKDRLHTRKLAQFEINLRDDSEEPGHEELQKLVTGYSRIKKNRVKHLQKFKDVKFLKNSYDYDSYLPPDKQSIIKKSPIFIKVKETLKESGRYKPKFCDTNLNNFRHLVTGFQNTNTLKWETTLRE
ncbi:unnamed protein product [Moneuplotes crassus]|uniref:Uncharacterized protein n=1 Tax=Euplotes crassus TaxID=5936 RepID=A0AAD1UUF0_EUPCR|nr:unnamed protein product [Moneuplotes crassus]